MNEQMTALIIKTFGKDGIIDRRASGDWILTDDDLDKLAESIVKECAKVVDDKLDFEFASGPDDWASGDDLLEHFGVE